MSGLGPPAGSRQENMHLENTQTTMKKQAFFYKNRYYLLPDGVDDVTELCETYAGKPAFPVTELVENKCQAPYFVQEHTKEKTLKLAKKHPVFPCEVELLTMREYNDRLRAMVPETCKGCPNYNEPVDETDESLDGHHEEISLDGVCFVRDEAKGIAGNRDFWPIDLWFQTVVRRFRPDEYAELIDEGRPDEAAERFYEELSETVFSRVPPVFFTRTPEGKYALYSTAFLEQQDSILMEYLFDRLTKKYKKQGWIFQNAIPKGYMPEEAQAPLGLTIETIDGPTPYLDVTVYTKPEGASAAYLWLCGTFGEIEYLAACVNHRIVTVEDGDPLPEDLLTPEEFGACLDEIITPIRKQKNLLINPPPHLLFGCDEELDENAPDLEDQFDLHTLLYVPRVDRLLYTFIEPLRHGALPENPWEAESIQAELGIPLARFVFSPLPENRLTRLNSPKMEAYHARIDEFFHGLSDSGYFKTFAQITGNGQLEVAGYVLNLTSFLYEVRRNSPIFAQCPGELFLYTESHKNGGHYRLGFDMKRLHKEQTLWKHLS